MPTSTTVRRITPAVQRNFGRIYDVFPVPDLTEIQTRSYERFLQADVPAEERADSGLEGVFREIFPIESYDKTLKLEYINVAAGKESPLDATMQGVLPKAVKEGKFSRLFRSDNRVCPRAPRA